MKEQPFTWLSALTWLCIVVGGICVFSPNPYWIAGGGLLGLAAAAFSWLDKRRRTNRSAACEI